jgi:type IV pilus assembly protein PilQ
MGVCAGLILAGLLPATGLSAVESKTISAVNVEQGEGGVTRIVLKGAKDAIYTAFMREDPPRLIIELPDVVFSGVATPIRIGNGVVENVTLGAFGDPRVALSMARVSIGLEGDAEYELLPEGDELVIEIRPTAAAMEPVLEAADVEAETADALASPEAETEAAVAESEEVPAAPDAQADLSRITSVLASGGSVVVEADGPIDNVDSFTLDAPNRLVLDFWGARSSVWPNHFEVEDSTVQQIRVGEHADKVRVVLDLGGPLESHVVKPSEHGVSIVLKAQTVSDSETEPTTSLPAAPADPTDSPDMEPIATEQDELVADEAPAVELRDVLVAKPELVSERATGAQVTSVHFESLASMDRLVVKLTNRVQTEVVEPDPETAIVMLSGGRIAADAERRIETAGFGGPVERFSVFKTPDVAYDEVRVVVKRQPNVKLSLSWADGQLNIEMPRSVSAASVPSTIEDSAEPQPVDMTGVMPTVADSSAGMHVPAARQPFAFDDGFGGPADPASVDILEEGGFDEGKEYAGRRVSLDFKDADIANILRLIAEVSDLNVIAGEEVSGKVTIRLVDVPWDQALDVILLTKGLGFVRVGNVLRIAPIDTLRLESERRLQERRAKEKLEDLIVKLQPVNFADVVDVQGLIKRLLSARGSVNIDKRTNTVIIKDIPSVVNEATALIKAIDTQTPQVMIEAKIVEASLAFKRALGAVWGVGYLPGSNPGGGKDFHLADGSNAAVSPFTSGNSSTNLAVANPIAEAATGLINLGVMAIEDQLQLDLQIQAMESTNKGKVISSPRVVTLDNREAVIKQGVAIKFETATRDRITISFIDAVLELKVTPHITANRSIVMKIKVSRNAPEISQATGNIVGISKNETETEALVKDGETLVLGGIYVVQSGGNRSKTPFISDIPLLGTLFQSKFSQDERRELLVFVTPRVIVGSPETAL